MSTVDELHEKAMDIAENAFKARKNKEYDTAKKLFQDALELEKDAANILPLEKSSEPTRSILYRSAAALAYHAEDFDVADWLIANGLSGYPPPEVKDELKDLYEDVNFRRHLSLKGTLLEPNKLRLTIWGNTTGYGKTLVDHLLPRIKHARTIFYRTVERLLNLPYRTSADVSREIKNLYGLYVDALEPSSFAVSFEISRPAQQLSLFPELEPKELPVPETITDELMTCFEMLQNEQFNELKDRIRNDDYLGNFVGVTKQLAPDGEDVKLVGFTSVHEGKERIVSLKKRRKAMPTAKTVLSEKVSILEEPETINLRGVLRQADSLRKGDLCVVKLLDEKNGKPKTIYVPRSLMKDVVQDFFEETVDISIHYDGQKAILDDINPYEEEPE